jgi:hypothetical protein
MLHTDIPNFSCLQIFSVPTAVNFSYPEGFLPFSAPPPLFLISCTLANQPPPKSCRPTALCFF